MAMHQCVHQLISMPINTMMQCVKLVTEAIEKENMRDQREIKIAVPAITAYASMLMCSVYTLQICSVPQEKDY